MTRAQRAFHAWVWTVLGPLMLIGLAAATLGRPPLIADSASESSISRHAAGTDSTAEVVR